MKVSKRVLACILAGCMSATALVGCGGSESSNKPGSSDVDTSGVKSIYFLNYIIHPLSFFFLFINLVASPVPDE